MLVREPFFDNRNFLRISMAVYVQGQDALLQELQSEGRIVQISDNMIKEIQKPLQKIQRVVAVMVLGAVGDALGYKNSDWEFQKSGIIIHKQFEQLTEGKGMSAFKINISWRYSDDTVMHIATAKALIKAGKLSQIQTIGQQLCMKYKECWQYMGGRSPGKSTGMAMKVLDSKGLNWNKIPYRQRAGGCGASMRTACIGTVFQDDLKKLVAVSIQAGRLTHHNAVAYLGGLTSALFTSLALKQVKIEIWPAVLLKEAIPLAEQYIRESGREVKLNLGENWKYFVDSWDKYVQLRGLSRDPASPRPPVFPKDYGVMAREHFYKEVSYRGWGGSSGHDSVIIAYDALIGCGGDWNQFCLRGVLHGGDNDSTGSIGGSWFGAMYGLRPVPQINYKQVQDYSKLVELGKKLYSLK